MQKRFITPWLKPNLLFNLTSLSKRQKTCIDIIHTFTRKVMPLKLVIIHKIIVNYKLVYSPILGMFLYYIIVDIVNLL